MSCWFAKWNDSSTRLCNEYILSSKFKYSLLTSFELFMHKSEISFLLNRLFEHKNLKTSALYIYIIYYTYILYHTSHYTNVLTYVSSTKSFAQRPGPDVCGLVVDGQALNAADKSTICPCCSYQPISTRGSTHIERGAESDLSVLTLEEWEKQNVLDFLITVKTPFNTLRSLRLLHFLNGLKGNIVSNVSCCFIKINTGI